jgi:hypothetical protein
MTDAAELIWTLNVELTPVYAIRPGGPYAAEAYQRLVEFLAGQIRPPLDKDWFVTRVAIPGVLTGETVRLFSGQVVPVLVPQVRGMASWNITKLIAATLKALGITDETQKQEVTNVVNGYLSRLYYLLLNLGQTSSDRALNYTATNAIQVAGIIADALANQLTAPPPMGVPPPPQSSKYMVLNTISVARSPYCRIDSDCWDVSISFFNPVNTFSAQLQYIFTVDVREAYPVFVGTFRKFLVPG